MTMDALLSSDVFWMLLLTLLFIVFVAVLSLSVRRAKKNGSAGEGDDPAAGEEPSGEEAAEEFSRDPDESDGSAADGESFPPDFGDSGSADCDGEDWLPPEPEAIGARVLDMRVVTGMVGTAKRPSTGASFLVTFLTDGGERVEYPVPEELYVTLETDQAGTLVTLNGGFFDFGDGEDAPEDGA